MTAPLSPLAARYRFNEGLLKFATDGFSDATWSFRPERGGNSAHWVLGHLVHARHGLLRMAGADVPAEDWEQAFGKGAVPDSGNSYPPVGDLVAKFREAGQRITDHFASMGEDATSAASPREFPDGSKTVGDALHFMYFHETYHLGQIGYVRRMEGLPGFI